MSHTGEDQGKISMVGLSRPDYLDRVSELNLTAGRKKNKHASTNEYEKTQLRATGVFTVGLTQQLKMDEVAVVHKEFLLVWPHMSFPHGWMC